MLHDKAQPTRILIVDDETFNLDAVKILLKYAVKFDTSLCDIAHNGEQALNKIKENVNQNESKHCNYKLILMDCHMPFMDGYEATKLIRQYLFDQGLEQPIISATTGHIEPAYVQKAFKSGMNQVLSKPV